MKKKEVKDIKIRNPYALQAITRKGCGAHTKSKSGKRSQSKVNLKKGKEE